MSKPIAPITPALSPVPPLSHLSRPNPTLAAGDDVLFPQLTEAGPHVATYQATTETGLVAAAEVEVEVEQQQASTGTTLVGFEESKERRKREEKIVTFTEQDQRNPRNFSNAKKWRATLLASLLCFNSGFASSVITGGLAPQRAEFNVSSDIINLTVAIFVVGFGLGPLLFAPLSEIYGRRLIYLISMGLFTLLGIGCALAPSAASLIVLRFLAGFAASAPLTNAAGTIGDVWDARERGDKLATYLVLLFASPCLGPLVGGYISNSVSWRWMYYVLLILSGLSWIVCAIWLPETYAPTLLRLRAEQLRLETGDASIMTEQELNARSPSAIAREALLRPLEMLVTEPVMICMTLYLSLVYSLLYGFFFAYPIVFEQGHNFTPGQVGLTFLSILLGIFLVGFIGCPLQERYYQRQVALSETGHAAPEARMPLMMVCSVILPLSLLIFASTASPTTHWAGALLSGVPFGASLMGIYISCNSYLVDVYHRYGASAMAAQTLVRSFAGASMPMWIPYLYKGCGNVGAGMVLMAAGWGMMPISFLFYKYGPSIRARSKMA